MTGMKISDLYTELPLIHLMHIYLNFQPSRQIK